MKKHELKPIQKELLRFLKELIPILEKNHIEYFACGGTMIGAVREKGFIPWDDDIDLFMTRPNYDKLMDLAKRNNNKINDFDVACGELKNSLLPFCKIFDKRYKLNAKGVEGDEDYLFIDIFPLDAVPDDDNERAEYFAEIKKRRKTVAISRLTYAGLFDVTKNKLLFIPKAITKLYISLTNPMKRLGSYLNLCKKYEFGTTKWTNSNVWGKGEIENIHTSKLKAEKFPFEDTKINVFADYDFYLTNDYGDYMKRPESSERETHDINIIGVQK